jgi:protein phosphatase
MDLSDDPCLEDSDAPTANPRDLCVRSFGITDLGRVRESNEDQLLIAEVSRALSIASTSLALPRLSLGRRCAHLFAVADGMGGERAGEVASALAIETLAEQLLDHCRTVLSPDPAALAAAARAADARIFDEADRHPELTGMGTTLTLVVAVGAVAQVVHVGDSRLYLARDGRLYQLTRDHTLVADLVEAGALTPREAERHHLRSIITNALGGNERGVRVELHEITLEPGDVTLLCTDGLSGMVPDARIAELLGERDPEVACRALVDEANARGGRDNVTAIVARFDPARCDD